MVHVFQKNSDNSLIYLVAVQSFIEEVMHALPRCWLGARGWGVEGEEKSITNNSE